MLASLPNRPKARVLVMDDELLIADSLVLILRQNGYDARAVYSGESAIATTRDWTPDLLLADIVMPGMNGVEAALEICSIAPDCRILFISGDLTTADLLDGYRDRGHDFHAMAKPVPPLDLLAAVADTIPSAPR